MLINSWRTWLARDSWSKSLVLVRAKGGRADASFILARKEPVWYTRNGYALVAQGIEQQFPKLRVVRSSRTGGASDKGGQSHVALRPPLFLVQVNGQSNIAQPTSVRLPSAITLKSMLVRNKPILLKTSLVVKRLRVIQTGAQTVVQQMRRAVMM